MSLSGKDFQTYAVYLSDDLKDSNGKSYRACIVPVRFNPLHCINDQRYLEGDRTPRIVRPTNVRKVIVESARNMFLESPLLLKQQYMM